MKFFKRQKTDTTSMIRPTRMKELRGRCRAGFSKTELIVSASILAVVMLVSMKLFYNCNIIWKDIRHHRIAVAELANSADALTRQPKSELDAACAQLKPSEVCERTLKEVALTATRHQDELGERVDLVIRWQAYSGARQALHPKQLKLSAWLKEGQ